MPRHVSRPGAVRGSRLLAVLAVVLGLLAMHGLVSGHHVVADRPGAGPGHGRSVSPAHLAPVVGAAAHPDHAAERAAAPAPPAAASAHPACPDCSDQALALLCLAVLTLGVAGLLRLHAGQPHRPVRAALLRVPARAAPRRPVLRPPDLVADLCVSRT